ncbi:MAG: hypothetical protein COV36_04940, partial [Alphaproteobacteria bacterium CG11_big_fil_rev_8_21_14_0_20_44_7]
NNRISAVIIAANYSLILHLGYFLAILLFASAFWAFIGFVVHPWTTTLYIFQTFWYVPLVFQVGWFAYVYIYEDKILSRALKGMPITRQNNHELYEILENLCISRGMQMPKFYIYDSDAVNAWTYGSHEENYSVTITQGMLTNLNADELQAVLAQQLSHIISGDTSFLVLFFVYCNFWQAVISKTKGAAKPAALMPKSASSIHDNKIIDYSSMNTSAQLDRVSREVEQNEKLNEEEKEFVNSIRISNNYSKAEEESGLNNYMERKRSNISWSSKEFGVIILVSLIVSHIMHGMTFYIYALLSKKRDFIADAMAVELVKNPDPLISALKKISPNSKIQGFPPNLARLCIDAPDNHKELGFLSTHPKVEERISALVQYAGGRNN